MTRTMRRFYLRSKAAFYAARANWREGQRACIPDAETGIESAIRHSELTDNIGNDRCLAQELRQLADKMK